MSNIHIPTDALARFSPTQPHLARLIAASSERLTRMSQNARGAKRLERLIIAARTLGAERRMGPRMPYRANVALQIGSMNHQTTSIDIGRYGIMLATPPSLTTLDSVDACVTIGALGSFSARLVGLDADCASLTFLPTGSNPAHDGMMRLITALTQENAAAIGLSQRFAQEISEAFTNAVSEHRVSMDDLFSSELTLIEGTDPPQFGHPAMSVFEDVLPTIMARYYRLEANMAYAVATTRDCFVPIHHASLSQPQRPTDLRFNQAFSRHRRIYDDRWTLRAAAFSPHPVVQACTRDIPEGFGALVRDVSAPLYVQGRHWGAAQIAYVLDREDEGPNEDRPRNDEADFIKKVAENPKSAERRDTQDPAWHNQVRILDWRRVGFHDLGIFRALALAVVVLGNLPKRVTLLHGVHNRGRNFTVNQQVALDLGDTHGVTKSQNNALSFLVRHRWAADTDLVAINAYLDASRQPVIGKFFLQGFSGGCLGRARTEDLRTSFLDEIKQSHDVFPRFSVVAHKHRRWSSIKKRMLINSRIPVSGGSDITCS